MDPGVRRGDAPRLFPAPYSLFPTPYSLFPYHLPSCPFSGYSSSPLTTLT